MTVESTKLTNEQSQQLITAMASSILSPTDKQYFMEKVQNIPDVFYIKGTNPGRIKPHISEPIDFQLKIMKFGNASRYHLEIKGCQPFNY